MVGCEKGLVKVYSAADFKPLFELQEQKVRVQRRVGCNDIRTHVVVIIPTPPTPRVSSHAWRTPRMGSGWPVVPQMVPSACGEVGPCNCW